MLYLSQLLGVPVEDQHSVRVGKIIDVLVSAAQVGQSEAVYPTALLIEGEADQPWRTPLNALERQDDLIRLLVPLEQLTPQAETHEEQEIRLAEDVLDKEVIDIKRKKAVRVNDVCLQDDWRVLGIDNSTLGLVRRLAPSWLLGPKSRHVPATLIPWERIELIGSSHREEQEPEGRAATGPHPVVRVPSGHLAELHPADIAEIVHQLTPGEGARIIERLDDEIAADTMEEIDTERQRHILE
ncbi:MAG: hypothetical protein JOZ18_09695, partial [Chloroflexi bacterium]|nr:hypothetical protein [Chloroflexota bacterium]